MSITKPVNIARQIKKGSTKDIVPKVVPKEPLEAGVIPIAKSFFSGCEHEKVPHKHLGCPICCEHAQEPDKFVVKYERKEHLFRQKPETEVYTFRQLIKDLIADPHTNQNDQYIKGCQILFPETLFLKDGKFEFIAQNDRNRDYSLCYDEKIQLNNMKIKIRLQEIVQERKKDIVMHSMHKTIAERLRRVLNVA